MHAFCLFVGYSRSGHSLVGALLDAHPEITIAHQVNGLKLVIEDNLSRRLLFAAASVPDLETRESLARALP